MEADEFKEIKSYPTTIPLKTLNFGGEALSQLLINLFEAKHDFVVYSFQHNVQDTYEVKWRGLGWFLIL